MNKSRLMLLIGALVSMTMLGGCGAISGAMNYAKEVVGNATGANDPNNTSHMAQAGRMQAKFMDAGAATVGVKLDDTAPPLEPTAVAPPESVPTPVAETVPTPAPAAKSAKPTPTAKKSKSAAAQAGGTPMVKPVAATTPPAKK